LDENPGLLNLVSKDQRQRTIGNDSIDSGTPQHLGSRLCCYSFAVA